MKSVLAGVLLVVAVAFADQCKTPHQFTAKFAMFSYNINQDKTAMASEGKVTYDADLTRIRVEGKHSGVQYSVIQLFKQGKQYVTSQGMCHVMPVQGEFQKFEIPDDAHVVNGGVIGIAPEHQVFVNRYVGEKDGAKYIATAAMTQTQCMPSSFVGISKKDGDNLISYMSLTDVDLNVDENMFKPPPNCKEISIGSAGRHRRSTGGGILDNPENIGL